MKAPLLFLVVLSALFAVGCRMATDTTAPVVNQSLSKAFDGLSAGFSDWVEGPEESLSQTRNLRVSLTLPASSDVYFLYTNVANDASVQNLAEVSGSRDFAPEGRSSLAPEDRPEPRVERASLRNLRPRASGSRALLPANDIPADPVVGTSAHFVDSLWTSDPTEANRHPMTLQVKQFDAAAGRTLFVWVVDDCFVGSDATKGTRFKVTQAMAKALADKFLDPANADDIYGLVTGFLGTEWAESGIPQTKAGRTYSGLITGNRQIHIVLGDLNPVAVDPAKEEPRKFGGGLQGYFHGWNNQTGWGSNQRILFAIDANNLGNPDKDGRGSTADPAGWTWSLLDSYYPNDVVATLAHEFQHMIHYYQKAILNGTSEADTWINEMASMAVEDLVAGQVGFRGPRGLLGNDYSTGTAPIEDGRLPLFNGTHEHIALQAWDEGLDALPHYANAYAFGAWLTRNYGGTAFWKDLVQGSGTSVQAVVDTVNKYKNVTEPTQTYASMVKNWGLAVFYGHASPRTPFVAPLAYAAASGNPFAFTEGSRTYQTGSINLYNYPMEDFDGSPITNSAGNVLMGPSRWSRPPTTTDLLGAGATWISRMGTGIPSGAWSRTVTLPPSVVLTVLVERR